MRAIVTSALRYRGQIEHCLHAMLDRKLPRNARHLVHTLHVAAAQIMYLDVADHAAVSLAVSALKEDQRSVRFASLGNAVLRRLSREKDQVLDRLPDEKKLELTISPWLAKRMRKDYGRQRMHKIAAQHLLEPIIDVTVKQDADQWAKTLGGVRLSDTSIRVARGDAVSSWPGYDEGQWWVQDFAATLPVRLFGDVTGKRVADLCAAPGGKTAQLIAAGADVTAVEAFSSRLERLAGNLKRLGMAAHLVEADLMDYVPDQPFDAILLDAPCSSTGTIRRHPDVQYTKSAQQIDEIAKVQEQMIGAAAAMLAPGGTLVFANCSIDRREGEHLIAGLDLATLGLELSKINADEVFGYDELITGQGTLRSLPCHLQSVQPPDGSEIDPARFTGLDGFFAARFTRT